MVLGAFAAIGQRNIKRLMAYSSIGHMGYALVGLAAGTEAGVQGVIIYLVIYMAMTLGAFACILAMRRREGMVEDIGDLAGLSKTHPVMAFMLAMILFSLAGIPPLAGFFAKFYVFLAAIESGLYVACGDRRARQRGRRLLLSAHHQDHVFRRSGAGLRADGDRNCGSCSACPGCFIAVLRRLCRPGRHRGSDRGQDVLLRHGFRPRQRG